MEIGEVLSKAWKIVWKHKILWLFGILAGCSSTGSSTSNNFSNSITYTIDQYPPWMDDLFSRTDQNFWIGFLIIFCCLAIVMVVILTVISIIGRIGLVRGALQADRGAEKITFSELVRGGLPYFWRVFGLTLIFVLGGFVFAAILIATAAGLAIVTLGMGLICLLPLLCLLMPVFILVYLIMDQATNAIVIENLRTFDGLGRAWQVIRTNPGTYALMCLILLIGVTFIGSFIVALPMILATLPLMFGTIQGSGAPATNGLYITLICLILYLPLMLIFYGILTSYVGTGFTLTYLRLTAPKQPVPPDISGGPEGTAETVPAVS